LENDNRKMKEYEHSAIKRNGMLDGCVNAADNSDPNPIHSNVK
jgi:hypothetical protein